MDREMGFGLGDVTFKPASKVNINYEIYQKSNLIGTMLLSFDNEEKLIIIEHIEALKKHSGFGRIMVHTLIEWAKENNFNKIITNECDPPNRDNNPHQFFKSLGFKSSKSAKEGFSDYICFMYEI